MKALRKVKIELPYSPRIPLLGIYLQTIVQNDTCIPVFIVALFTTVRTCQQPKCPSVEGWIKKMWSVQFSSVTQSGPILCDPWTAACQASMSIMNSLSLLKLLSIESVMPSNHLIPPPAFNLSHHQGLTNESVLLIRRPKYWSFSFSISPSNENLGLISFRIDWLDLLAVQGTLKSLFQHHSSKVSILWCSAFSMVQLSHLYMTTGNTMVLIIQIFVGKVITLFFNILPRFVMAFPPKSKHL